MVILLVLLVVGINSLQFTVSGFSSGGFMAHQLHVAYSSSITAAGIIAGGPYYCSLGTSVRAATACTLNPFLLNLNQQVAYALAAAANNTIDNPKNLSNDKVFIFSGTKDQIVIPSVVNLTEQFYRNFIKNDYQYFTVYNISAVHSWVTNMYGNPCWAYAFPGIVNCDYDMAEAMFRFFYNPSNFKGNQIGSNLLTFDQAKYGDV